VDEQTGNLLTNTKDLITTHQRAASLVDATALSQTLMDELAPQTAYEHLLASNIIELELGYLASRARVASILRAACRDIVWQTIVRLSRDIPLAEAEQLGRDVAIAFTRCDASADETLREYGIIRDDIEGQAYRENWVLLREIDQVQARFEARRAALMSDYRQIQSTKGGRRTDAINDAEVA
jgi:hypothetical protein